MFRSFKSHTIIIDTFQRTKLNFTMCFMLLSQTFIPNFHTYFTTVGIFLGDIYNARNLEKYYPF